MLSDSEFKQGYLAALRRLVASGTTVATQIGGSGAQHRPPPYFSGIGGCARAVFYEMVASQGEMVRNPDYEPQHPWQTTIGYVGQELVSQALSTMGYEVFDEEKRCEWNGLNGRIDGKLRGHDLGSLTAIWDCKLRNSFAITSVVRTSLPEKKIVYQMHCGMAAEDADLAIVTFHPYDVSDTRSRLKMSKIYDYDPHVVRVVIERSAEIEELLIERVDMLKLAMEIGVVPAREYDPYRTQGLNECNICPWKQQCLMDGDEREFEVTALPYGDE